MTTGREADRECPAVYGPVQSRRHGMSLGINLGVQRKKICTWGCLYCQCGIGETRDIGPAEREVSTEDIQVQVEAAIAAAPHLDSITFAGNSEPTAHPGFPGLVKWIVELRADRKASWIINGLSNGSELDCDEVVEACDRLDEVWFKLDCATDAMFRSLNRPLARIGGVGDHVRRLSRMRPLRVQTLAWRSPNRPELSNWTPENRRALLKVYGELMPREIHLTTVARLPATPFLSPVSEKELTEFATLATRQGLAVEVFA